MMYRFSVLIIVASTQLGCSALPHYASDDRILPEDIGARVQCELRLAAQLHSRPDFNLNDYGAGYTITVKVETEANPSAKIDWTIPVPIPKSFGVGASAGVTDNILRDGSLQFQSFDIAELQAKSCPAYLAQAYAQDLAAAQMTYGSFGLIDWIEKISKAVQPNSLAKPNKADYTLKFTLTASGNASPTYKIVNLTTSGALALKRVNTHSLAVSLVKKSKPGPLPPPAQVCVVNIPGAKPCDEQKMIAEPDRELRELLPSKKKRPSLGLDQGTRQQIEQQLDLLRLRDILRQ